MVFSRFTLSFVALFSAASLYAAPNETFYDASNAPIGSPLSKNTEGLSLETLRTSTDPRRTLPINVPSLKFTGAQEEDDLYEFVLQEGRINLQSTVSYPEAYSDAVLTLTNQVETTLTSLVRKLREARQVLHLKKGGRMKVYPLSHQEAAHEHLEKNLEFSENIHKSFFLEISVRNAFKKLQSRLYKTTLAIESKSQEEPLDLYARLTESWAQQIEETSEEDEIDEGIYHHIIQQLSHLLGRIAELKDEIAIVEDNSEEALSSFFGEDSSGLLESFDEQAQRLLTALEREILSGKVLSPDSVRVFLATMCRTTLLETFMNLLSETDKLTTKRNDLYPPATEKGD